MIVGLTGSIAMGKTTTAAMFESLGYPVFDADKEVHRLYEKGGKAAQKIAKILPDVIINGAVDRGILAAKIAQDKTVLPRIEKIVHPMVHQLEKQFIDTHQKAGVKIMVLDIPLLFEADRIKDVDTIVVVTADEKIQRQRVLQRPGMTGKKLQQILMRQLSDEKKRQRADFVIDTSLSLEDTFEQVKAVIQKLLSPRPEYALAPEG